MENILVAIDSKRGGWEAISHACFLAKRVNVRINVLLVTPECNGLNCSSADAAAVELVRRRVDLHIETAKTEGLTINYFITEGNYEEEVISFVHHHKITLFMCQIDNGEKRATEREMASLLSLKHRIACKMEIVAPRKKNEE